MAKTTTGSFPIGFRRGWSEWQKDLAQVISFARGEGFETIDVGPIDVAEVKQIVDAGLNVGTVDAKAWSDLASADAGKRKDAVAANVEYAKALAPLGVRNLFIVIIPEDPTAPRKQNFEQAVAGLGALGEQLAGTGVRLSIEGWPGPAPHFPSIGCTAADYRALIKALPEGFGGVNFDPSHLIRMFIDPVRFLDEFAANVVHVHGKDTEVFEDQLYEHGTLQSATFAEGRGFGAHYWRYTLPGHGCARWTKLMTQLVDAGYDGSVCIELEDDRYNGSTDGEKRGLTVSRDFLASV